MSGHNLLTSLSIWRRISLSLKKAFHSLPGFGFNGYFEEEQVLFRMKIVSIFYVKHTWSSMVTSVRWELGYSFCPGLMIISLTNCLYTFLCSSSTFCHWLLLGFWRIQICQTISTLSYWWSNPSFSISTVTFSYRCYYSMGSISLLMVWVMGVGLWNEWVGHKRIIVLEVTC